MVAEQNQKQSIFPDVPRESPETDKDGNFTALWSLSFGALFQALQDNFKNEGIIFPGLSSDNVAMIQSLYSSYIGGTYDALTLALPDISGQTIYNQSTQITNQFVIAKDGDGVVTLAEWVPLTVMLTFPTNPNPIPQPPPDPPIPGLAGVLNWLCYDIADKQLWICTTAGSTTTAAWTLIL